MALPVFTERHMYLEVFNTEFSRAMVWVRVLKYL